MARLPKLLKAGERALSTLWRRFENADFQTYIVHAPGRHHFWDDTDQYANFVTLTSIDALRGIDANVSQALQFWRMENESEGRFNTNWQADCTQKSVQHMSGCFSPERYKLACQPKKNTCNVIQMFASFHLGVNLRQHVWRVCIRDSRWTSTHDRRLIHIPLCCCCSSTVNRTVPKPLVGLPAPP